MIVTWTVCKVPISQRKAFSMIQEAGGRYTQCDGFLGRIGGWNIKKPTEASILTFWQDERSYQRYQLMEANEWNDLERWVYHSTQQYERILDIPGQKNQKLFSSFEEEGNVIKIGDIHVKAGERDQFMLMQQGVWNLSMSNAPGMMTGLFAESQMEEHRFLVITRWRSEEQYQAYENHLLPKLLHWTYGADVRQFQGRCVQLEQKWSVEDQ